MEADFSFTEVNFLQLQGLLDDFEKELRNPYLTSRPKFGDDLEPQIRHALSEISHREKDLTASIGISKVLLAANTTYQEKLKQAVLENDQLRQKIEETQAENLKIKEELHHIEDKCDELSNNLEKAEDQLSLTSSELHKLMRERSKKNVHLSLDSISLDRFIAEISDITSKFREEYNSAISNSNIAAKRESEKKCQELEDLLSVKERTIDQLEKSAKFRHASTDVESVCSQSVSRPSIKTVNESMRYSLEEIEFGLETKNSMENDPFNIFYAGNPKTFEVVKLDGMLIKAKADHLQDFTEEIFFNMVKAI